MFADPLVLPAAYADAATIANVLQGTGFSANSFVCTGRGPSSSTYRLDYSSSHRLDILISVQKGKRTRSTVRITETELVTDPINSELNSAKTATMYIVADVGVLGTTTYFTTMGNYLARFLFTGEDFAPLIVRVLAGET
jgi:hypothetical protein